MIGKIEIDEAKKKRIVDRAAHLGDEVGEYGGLKFGACAPLTFTAICNAFRSEGIELYTPEVQELMTQGMIGLHGGVATTGIGTCGAITSSAFIIASVVGVSTEELFKNPRLNATPAVPIVSDIMDRFEEVYGATDCLRLRYNRVQRTFDFLDPDALWWEALFASYEADKCGACSNCYECGRDQAIPSVGARWAAESICDLLNMEPEERKTLPPHLQGLSFGDFMPKVEKVIAVMKEVGFGRPNEKISWREYRTLKLKGKKGLEESRPCGTEAPDTKEYGKSA